MGLRGPKPSGDAGKHVGAIVDGETFEDLEDTTHTRKRSRSFIAAEAIRLGLPEVKKLYPAVRKSRRRARPAAAKKPAAKKPAASTKGKKGAAARAK